MAPNLKIKFQNLWKKTEPKKLKVPTGQQVRNDNPLPIFIAKNAKNGQDPLKKISPEKRSIQARDSTLYANDKSRQRNQRDKIKSPQPNKTINDNPKQFQITNPLVLSNSKMYSAATMEASATITTSMETSDTTMEEVTITTQVDRNKETTIAHTTSKKKVTTIFVMKKAKAKVPMPKMTSKKEIATPKHKEEVTTSNEELLEAVKKDQEDQEDKRNNEEEEAPPVTSIDSDEELLQAAIKLEDLQLSGSRRSTTSGTPSSRWPAGCPTPGSWA